MSAQPSLSASAAIEPLHRDFFDRHPRQVARDLLGKVLVRGRSGSHGPAPVFLAARIVEVEAYLGESDAAAHASAGKTARTSVLFGPPGYAYVYFIYGNHYCLNVSCQREGKAGCVLFRALEPLIGVEDMAQARGITLRARGATQIDPRDLTNLTSGPGRLTEAFGITRARDNGCDLTSPHSGLWLGDDGFCREKVMVTPRIGITKATEQPLRYLLMGNSFVSGRKGMV